ncbi:MAG: plastocyanin/azurin family copper-binding protein [Pseudomonadota bacterium]
MFKRSFLTGIGSVVAAVFLPRAAMAEGNLHVIKMITEDGSKLYAPDLLHVAVGDQVQFVNVSGHHNTESIEGMIPEGAKPWFSEIDETFKLTITHEGVYGYRCTPHYENGMVGLIVAGDASVNLEQAKAVEHPIRPANLFKILLGLVK